MTDRRDLMVQITGGMVLLTVALAIGTVLARAAIGGFGNSTVSSVATPEPPTATASRPPAEPTSQPPTPSPTSPPLAEVLVPRLVGLPQAEAEAELADAGLTARIVTTDATAPEDEVVEAVPSPGTQVPRGTQVELIISLGTLVEVPNVVGEFPQDAIALLSAADLQHEITTVEGDDAAQDGLVVGQLTEAGEAVPKGHVVVITVYLWKSAGG